MSDSWFDTALICVHGHMITSQLQTKPELAEKFCRTCGAGTISRCPECQTPIRGYRHVPRVISTARVPLPSYCHECGAPYPWTVENLKAAEELIGLSDLSQEDKDSLVEDLPALIADTPRTKVAVAKTAQFLKKAGAGIASGFRDILVDVASEAAKKSLGL